MDLEKILQAGYSKTQCLRIVRYINGNPARFYNLLMLFLKGEYKVVQRASWPLSYCIEKHPSLINPHWNVLVKALEQRDAHPAVCRNIFRLLQFIPSIPEKYQGRIMTVCFDRISRPEAKAAEKAFALTVLDNLSKLYPDIKQELCTIIRERWDQETPAFRSRGKKILRNADLHQTLRKNTDR